MAEVIKTLKKCSLIPAIAVSENESVIEVAKKLHRFQERRIFVVNNKKFPVGIISIVDINDRVVANGLDIKKTKARDIMSYPIKIILDINTPIKEVKKRMVMKDNYYCPVVENGILKGLINYSNLLESLR